MLPTDNTLNVDLHDLTKILIRHFDLHEGRYQLTLAFRIGVGAVGGEPGTNNPVPGAMIGVEGLGLGKVADDAAEGPNIVDAAVVNPAKKRRTKAA